MIAVAICVAGSAEPAPGVTAALGGRAVVVRADTVWQARRRALAECDTEVLALVDGDVRVPPEWLERLEAAWTQAPQEIAAIGGPLRMGGDASASSSRRQVAATLDLGAEQLDLDPLERTLLGGNLSFRVAPLMGAGGFGPTVDRRDARDWLAEEHEAQRQLGHWGWLVRYDPALGAERLPGWSGAGRGGRFRYGLRLGVARSRPGGTAVRALAPAAAGALLARVQRRPALARERGARVAENAGVLLAPLLAAAAWRRRGEWPDEGAVASASGGGSAHRARHRGSPPLVLLYHRIAQADGDPLGLCVAPAHFREQLAVLRERFEIVSLDEIAAGLAAGAPPAGAVAITFDDGYADNVPALTEAGIPATLFVATGHVESGRPFFWDEARRLLLGAAGARPLELELDGARHTLRAGDPGRALSAFHRLVQPRSAATIAAALEQLRAWAGDTAPPNASPLMLPEDVKRLDSQGIAIGAHTRNHVNLAHQPAEVVAAEVEGSRDDIEQWTGRRPRGFSYPFGLPRHDVDAVARQAAESAGFAYAVVNQPIPVPRGADPFAIPRLFAPDLGGAAFRDWLTTKLAGSA